MEPVIMVTARLGMFLGMLLVIALPLVGIAALVLGIVALVRINKSGGELRGRGLAIAAIVIGGLMMLAAPLVVVIGVPVMLYNSTAKARTHARIYSSSRRMEMEAEARARALARVKESRPPATGEAKEEEGPWLKAAGKLGPQAAELRVELPRLRACFESALAAAIARDAEKFFAGIADGGGGDSFKLVPAERAAMAAAAPGFWKHNCPDYAGIQKAVGKMKFSGIAFKRNAAKLYTKGSSEELGRGDLWTMEVEIPGFKDSRHRTLRFVRYKGKWYWVPFGW